ncbi:MAG: ubiquinol-cytochrome c reductase iron-sulfur subunit [Gemmatimonadaceae bacterium]
MKSFQSENTEREAVQEDACAGCALHDSRREFLRDVAASLAAIAALLSLPASGHAIVVRLASVSHVSGTEVSYPLPEADGVTIDKEREVILVRWAGAVYAFRLSCPHQRTALKWKEKDGRFQCPKHKSKYQPDGTFISGRATRGMDRYSVRRKKGEIVVDVSKVHLEDKDEAGWRAAVVKL